MEYRYCGVLYDRETGHPLRTFTVLDGWTDKIPEDFAPMSKSWYRRSPLIGPGVIEHVEKKKSEEFPVAAVASIEFGGNRWMAYQCGVWEATRKTSKINRSTNIWRSARIKKGCQPCLQMNSHLGNPN